MVIIRALLVCKDMKLNQITQGLYANSKEKTMIDLGMRYIYIKLPGVELAPHLPYGM